jgi:hypothetical protein
MWKYEYVYLYVNYEHSKFVCFRDTLYIVVATGVFWHEASSLWRSQGVLQPSDAMFCGHDANKSEFV